MENSKQLIGKTEKKKKIYSMKKKNRLYHTMYVLALIGIVLFPACQTKNINHTIMNWKEIDVYRMTPEELRKPYQVSQFYIQDSLHGYIVGNYNQTEWEAARKEQRRINKANNQAIVFYTEDSGMNFTKSDLGQGNVERIFGALKSENIYILVNRFTEGLQQLLVSEDHGRTWKTIFEKNHVEFYSCQFYDNRRGFISFKEKDKKYILTTSDGGMNWVSHVLTEEESQLIVNGVFLSENVILSPVEQSRTALLYHTESKEITRTTLPGTPQETMEYGRMIKDDSTGEYYVELYDQKLMEMEYPAMASTKKLLHINNQDVLTVAFPGETGYYTISNGYIGTFIEKGTKTSYYYSEDSGTTWQEELLPHPIVFHGQKALYRNYAWQEDRGLFILQVRIP